MIRSLFAAAAIAVAAVGAAPPASADPLADLMDMLPAGYSSDSCKPAYPTEALAAVNCWDNSLPGGPTYATYWLFGDYKAMYDAFTAYLNSPGWAAATCPGMHSSDPIPAVGSDGTQYGSIACGRGTTPSPVRDGAVAWTRDADRFLGVAYVGYQGQAYPASLFNWVRAQQISSDCAAAGGTYTTWIGDAGIRYSSCCYEDIYGKKYCDDYVNCQADRRISTRQGPQSASRAGWDRGYGEAATSCTAESSRSADRQKVTVLASSQVRLPGGEDR